MAKVNMNVKLLEMSQNAVSLIYVACRQCYSEKFAGEIFSDNAVSLEKQEAFSATDASDLEPMIIAAFPVTLFPFLNYFLYINNKPLSF